MSGIIAQCLFVVQQVEDFWAVYSHLRRARDLPIVSDYQLFKQGVRPVWEVCR